MVSCASNLFFFSNRTRFFASQGKRAKPVSNLAYTTEKLSLSKKAAGTSPYHKSTYAPILPLETRFVIRKTGGDRQRPPHLRTHTVNLAHNDEVHIDPPLRETLCRSTTCSPHHYE